LNWLTSTNISKYFKIEDRSDRTDELMMKKTYAATGWPSGKERILETGRGSTIPHSVEN